jgi:hypothetical protein
LAWARKHWETLICRVIDLHVPVSVEEQDEWVADWIKGSNSSPSVKQRIRDAWAALRADGFDMHSPLPSDLAWEWTKRDACVKNETVLKDSSTMPRQIMAAPPQFVAIVAPFIKALTGFVRRKLQSGNLIYAPGMPEEELSRMVSERHWDHRANGDFNAYDSNQGRDMGEEECSIFKRYGAATAMRQLLRANLDVHGGSRLGVKFELPYCRLSGDPHTTLMNTVWNLLAMSFVYCEARGCHPRDMDVLFLAGGDDSQLNYDGEIIDFESGLAALGLPATVVHVAEMSEVEFLSCRLTRTTRGWRFIPMVGKLIGKLAFSVRATPDTAAAVLRGGALSLVAQMSGSPIGIAYIDTLLRITSGVTAVPVLDEPWKMLATHTGSPTDETWDDLLVQYSWNEALQSELEADLALVTSPATLLDSDILRVLIDMDCGRKDVMFEKKPESDSERPAFSAWVRDLTADGVEPNPGPSRRQPRRRNPAVGAVIATIGGANTGRRMRVVTARRAPVGVAVERRTTRPRAARAGSSGAFNQSAAPAAFATTQRSGKPLFVRATFDRTRIVHRELIQAVNGTTSFTVSQFPLNPGLSVTFPWLATQAVAWEKYRFNRLAFCYYTRAPTSTQGSFLHVPDYDAADPAPTTETIASTYNGAVEDAVWKDSCCELDVKMFRELFIRTGALAQNLDIKTYDTGNFFSCTTDASSASPIGKLWVEYDIELINPQLPATGISTTATVISGGTVTVANPLGTAPVAAGGFGQSISGSDVTYNGLTAGVEYYASFITSGTSITATALTTSGFNLSTTQVTSAINAAGTAGIATFTLIPTGTSGVIGVSAAGATVTSSRIIFAQLPTMGF